MSFPRSVLGVCLYGTKSQPMTTAWHQHSSREVVAAAEAQSTSSALPLPGWRLLREGPEAPVCAGQVWRGLQGLTRLRAPATASPTHSLLCPGPHTPRVPQPVLPPLLPSSRAPGLGMSSTPQRAAAGIENTKLHSANGNLCVPLTPREELHPLTSPFLVA